MFEPRATRIVSFLATVAFLCLGASPAGAQPPGACSYSEVRAFHCSDSRQGQLWGAVNGIQYPPNYGGVGVSYDWHQGTFRAWVEGSGDLADCGAEQVQGASVECWDWFRIQGLAPGTPLHFSVGLRVHSEVRDAPSNVHADLHAGSQGMSLDFSPVPPVFVQDTLGTLQMDINSDEGFLVLVYIGVSAKWMRPVWGFATLEFSGLPPGAVASSCFGYGAPPVATRPTTWGRLKAIYR